jgi:hypothetical protein
MCLRSLVERNLLSKSIDMAQNHENYQTRLDFIRGLLRERYHLEVSGLEDIHHRP